MHYIDIHTHKGSLSFIASISIVVFVLITGFIALQQENNSSEKNTDPLTVVSTTTPENTIIVPVNTKALQTNVAQRTPEETSPPPKTKKPEPKTAPREDLTPEETGTSTAPASPTTTPMKNPDQQEESEDGQSTTTPEAESVANPKTHSIIYLGNRFDPAEITITKGDTVIFENGGSTKMWVASDFHPTHTVLPDFEQGNSVEKFGVYSYTFIQTGTWNYHNHLSASHTGKVIVQ